MERLRNVMETLPYKSFYNILKTFSLLLGVTEQTATIGVYKPVSLDILNGAWMVCTHQTIGLYSEGETIY